MARKRLVIYLLWDNLDELIERTDRAFVEAVQKFDEAQKTLAQGLAETAAELLQYKVEALNAPKQAYKPVPKIGDIRKGGRRKPFWLRVRSNPQRRRKPH